MVIDVQSCRSCENERGKWEFRDERWDSYSDYSIAQNDWGLNLLSIFSGTLKALTLIDQAVLSKLIPYRRTVEIIDYSHGSKITHLRLKGMVITLQTNQRERLVATKNTLFRYNLDEVWKIMFVGKGEDFTKAGIFQAGECFRRLVETDVVNVIKWQNQCV